MTGALAGSTITSMTGDKIAGAAVGGQITGGTTGALLGVAGAAGSGKDVRGEAAAIEREQDATSIVPPAKSDVVSSAEQDIRNLMANISPGVQTADLSGGIIAMPKGVRDEESEKLGINLPRIGSDMTVVDPESKGTLPTVSVVAPRDEPITFQEGQPDLPELDKAGEGLLVLSDRASTGGSISNKTAKDAKRAGNAAPAVISGLPGGGVIELPGDGTGDQQISTLIGTVKGTDAGGGGGTPGAGTGTGTGTKGTGTGAGTGGTGTGGGGTGMGNEEEPTEEEPTEEEEDGYRPDLFIYGGKSSRGGGGRQTTRLGTTLQPPFSPSTTLGQALTGYRGAGEIEGKKTGKPRREVWNEESLRLKDALGL
jgi:hypothetical protein